MLVLLERVFRVGIRMSSVLQKAHTSLISQNPNIFVDYRMVTNKQLQSL